MVYTLENEKITAKISDFGAELISVVRKEDGCEYIWQADARYWGRHAPWLFPICSHFYEDTYTYRGKTYHMGSHGFARQSTFTAEQKSEVSLDMTLLSSDQTKAVYPFDFALTIHYTLEGETLRACMDIRNEGQQIMPVAPGGHPGFNVPLDGKGAYEDWYLEFEQPCDPDEMILTDTLYNSGIKRAYPLRDGNKMDLRHSMFVIDGVFLANVSTTVSLRSSCSDRFVTMKHPQMPYLGIWSKPKSDAPYVCIEPWRGLPSYDGSVEDLETRNDMFRLQPGEQRQVSFEFIFG